MSGLRKKSGVVFKHTEGGKRKKKGQYVGFRCVQSQVSGNDRLNLRWRFKRCQPFL